MPYLTLMTFTPLVGALFILFLPKDNVKGVRTVAAFFATLALLFTLFAWGAYDSNSSQIVQLVEGNPYIEGKTDAGYAWIPTFNIYYFVGVDGLSLPLLLLTALLSLVAVITSFNIENRVKEYFFFLLLLEAGMMGVFSALDFFLFYFFWEIMLVPMYFLIGIWGGPKKEFAAIKFFLYTRIHVAGDAGALFLVGAEYLQHARVEAAGGQLRRDVSDCCLPGIVRRICD